MACPLIAVVGSVQKGREYNPPLEHAADARRACEELGRELANQGCDILVYSSDPKFIEADIVRGYVASGKALTAPSTFARPMGRQPTLRGLRSNPTSLTISRTVASSGRCPLPFVVEFGWSLTCRRRQVVAHDRVDRANAPNPSGVNCKLRWRGETSMGGPRYGAQLCDR
jgi:hypothetical protein